MDRSEMERGEEALGDERGCVFEDGGAEEWGRNPNGFERRNRGKLLRRLRSGEEDRGGRMFIAAGSEKRHRALVIGRVAIGMDERVKTR